MTIFYLDRKDAQVRDSDGSGGFFATTSNGGMPSTTDWSINQAGTSKRLSFHSEVGLLKAKLKNSNRDLANAPSYSYGFKLLYTPQNRYFGSLHSMAQTIILKRTPTISGEMPLKYQCILGINQSTTLSLWVNNLFNQSYSSEYFTCDNYNPSQAGATDYRMQSTPRTYGIHLTYNW